MRINLYAALSISCIALVMTLVIVGCHPPAGLTPSGKHVGLDISKFSYENHDYILFESGIGQSHTASVVHSPHCHCQVKAEIE